MGKSTISMAMFKFANCTRLPGRVNQQERWPPVPTLMRTIGLGHIDLVPILFGRADVEPDGDISWGTNQRHFMGMLMDFNRFLEIRLDLAVIFQLAILVIQWNKCPTKWGADFCYTNNTGYMVCSNMADTTNKNGNYDGNKWWTTIRFCHMLPRRGSITTGNCTRPPLLYLSLKEYCSKTYWKNGWLINPGGPCHTYTTVVLSQAYSELCFPKSAEFELGILFPIYWHSVEVMPGLDFFLFAMAIMGAPTVATPCSWSSQ